MMAEEKQAGGESPRHHQEKVGIVTSAKMQKTIVVQVHRRVQHPVYKRIVTKRSKFMVHDEHKKAHEGDMVDRREPPSQQEQTLDSERRPSCSDDRSLSAMPVQMRTILEVAD